MANRKPKLSREEFKLYDVVDTCGPYAGLKNNLFPLDLKDAEKMAADPGRVWARKVVRTKDRKWEDYAYECRHVRRLKPLGLTQLGGGE